MLLPIPDVLSGDALSQVTDLAGAAEWVDGNVTSGAQAALAKRNLQIPEESEAARRIGGIVLDALGACATFVAAALPLKVYPPLINRYAEGHGFGTHVDNAVRIRRGSDFRVRSDLSATLFLSDPADYEGGELSIEDHFGTQRVKLAAGSMILYPASSLHHVTPVTRGARTACFFWIQSMVRDDDARRSLFDLDRSIQALAAQVGADDPSLVRLTGVYHNLLRRWAEL